MKFIERLKNFKLRVERKFAFPLQVVSLPMVLLAGGIAYQARFVAFLLMLGAAFIWIYNLIYISRQKKQ